MLSKILVLFAASFLVLSVNTTVTAEEALVSAAAQEEWNPPSAGPITTWTAPLCGKGKFVIQPFIFYNRTRGTFNSQGHYDSLPEGGKKYQYQQQLFMQYGVMDRLEVDGQVVYQENFVKNAQGKAQATGLGDSYLFLRYCFNDETKFTPHITGLFQLKAPTGKYQHLDPDKLETDSMGAGSWDPGFGFNLTKKLKPFIFHADTIFSFPQKVMIDGAKIRYANYVNYDFGVEYFLPKGFNLMFEANGFLQGDKWVDGQRSVSTAINYLTISPGIGWSCDKLQLLLAYQRVVLGTNTDANDSVVLTGVYTF